MKASALFHLLQSRARKFDEQAPPDTVAAIHEVQQSLAVGYKDGRYGLRWQYGGRHQTLDVPGETFTFYVAGDLSRTPTPHLRDVNWRAAETTWRQIASASGFSIQILRAVDETGLAPPVGAARSLPLYAGVVMTVLAGAMALPLGGLAAAAGVAVSGALLLAMGECLATTHRPHHLRTGECAAIAGSALAPLVFGGSGWPLVPALASAVCACLAERTEGLRATVLWGVAGAVAGMAASQLGRPALVSAWVLIGAVIVVACIAPIRFKRSDVAWLVLSAFVAGAGGAFVRWPLFPIGGHAWPAAAVTAAIVGSGLALVCLLSWVHGTLFRVMPWISSLALAALSLGAAVSGHAPLVAAVTALAGLTACFALRVSHPVH